MSKLRIDIKQIGAVIHSSGLRTPSVYQDLKAEEYDFAATVLITKAGLAKKRENLGPSWPRELGDALLYLAPDEAPPKIEEHSAVAAMAWPLLDAEGLAMYLERYTPAALTEAAKLSTHVRHGLMKRMPAPPQEDHVRVLRVIEYTGPRALVERQVQISLHGTRGGIQFLSGEGGLDRGAGRPRENDYGPRYDSPVQITAVTLGEYPEVLERAKLPQPAIVGPELVPPPTLGVHDALVTARVTLPHPSEPEIHGDVPETGESPDWTSTCLCVIGCTVNSACPVHGKVDPF